MGAAILSMLELEMDEASLRPIVSRCQALLLIGHQQQQELSLRAFEGEGRNEGRGSEKKRLQAQSYITFDDNLYDILPNSLSREFNVENRGE
jgi:hypothetical protein